MIHPIFVVQLNFNTIPALIHSQLRLDRQMLNCNEVHNLQVCIQQFKAYAQMSLIHKKIIYTNNVMLILRIILLI